MLRRNNRSGKVAVLGLADEFAGNVLIHEAFPRSVCDWAAARNSRKKAPKVCMGFTIYSTPNLKVWA